MIKRILKIKDLIEKGKVLMIYGPRQVGKTTLVKMFLDKTKLKYRYDTGDSFEIANNLSQCTYKSTDEHVENYDLIVIDEAQKIENIGNALKLMVDRYPEKYYIVTGSSSFDLANKIDESLTGRKNVYTLYPISQLELNLTISKSELKSNLENYLIYGSYPEVLSKQIFLDKEFVIKMITNSYLIKDILEFNRIKNSQTIYKLLKLLAFQIGSEVSTTELASQLSIDVKTVSYYLDLLQKSFVIFPLYGFSRNLRSEISKMNKFYFYDVGIRNALISNFNKLDSRDDIGQIWENFVLTERIKLKEYSKTSVNYYFWRTYGQQEIDLIEEAGGKISGYEFKWQKNNSKSPKLWLQTYPNASYQEINRENYFEFIL
ncbi:ATP-binding protein [Patescibacteria group bacterium]|nr:ATP-binding protein [Patescibacteria group bacterium]